MPTMVPSALPPPPVDFLTSMLTVTPTEVPVTVVSASQVKAKCPGTEAYARWIAVSSRAAMGAGTDGMPHARESSVIRSPMSSLLPAAVPPANSQPRSAPP